jgi:sorbitol-specific phosphotransferase system component IIC
MRGEFLSMRGKFSSSGSEFLSLFYVLPMLFCVFLMFFNEKRLFFYENRVLKISNSSAQSCIFHFSMTQLPIFTYFLRPYLGITYQLSNGVARSDPASYIVGISSFEANLRHCSKLRIFNFVK